MSTTAIRIAYGTHAEQFGELRASLADYEKRYSMPSQEFYDRYRAGELGDSSQFVDRAGLCYLAVGAGILDRARDHSP